jgi:phosphatidylinositol alpha-1,6-mannosyltransferase
LSNGATAKGLEAASHVASARRLESDSSRRVLLLSPSQGLGGGIERYVETLEWAFAAQEIPCQRIDLRHPGTTGQIQMLTQGRRLLAQSTLPTRLVVAHRALLPTACMLARGNLVYGISVLCHGCDAWDSPYRPRRHIENRLMRLPTVRVVAVSNFTAGVIARRQAATVLPPGLSTEWFSTLVAAGRSMGKDHSGIRLVTAFRLSAWREKGLPQLMQAVAALGRPDVSLTVCGSGEPPAEFLRAVRESAVRCSVRQQLSDQELASDLAGADLFVLATRTRIGRYPSGEGFGLVLLEAQVAGTPVVGPAYGGSPDSYIDRVTGVAPPDESAEALKKLLASLLADPQGLAKMGQCAAEWARDSFTPKKYAALAVSRLL